MLEGRGVGRRICKLLKRPPKDTRRSLAVIRKRDRNMRRSHHKDPGSRSIARTELMRTTAKMPALSADSKH